MLIAPEHVDDDTVVVRSSHAGLVDVDDRGIVVDEEAGRAYALNPTATLVWRLLDGASPVGALIEDLSDAFAAPRAEVADGVLGLVRYFGLLGLLDNVARHLSTVPIDVEYVGDGRDCGPGESDPPTFDDRYLAVPPNT